MISCSGWSGPPALPSQDVLAPALEARIPGGKATETNTIISTTRTTVETTATTEQTTTATTTPVTTTTTASEGPAWLTTEMTDVTTGKTFSVGGLATERPVLLETFAVWCPVCTGQQFAASEFHKQHEDLAFSVSLNIDPNESPTTVLEHVEENGLDWRYACPSERL